MTNLGSKSRIKEKYLLYVFLFLVHTGGLVFSGINYIHGERFPVFIYEIFLFIQICTLWIQFQRRNYMTSATGFIFTAMLWLATAIENTALAKDLSYNGYLSANVYTPSLIATAYHVLLGTSSLFFLITFSWGPIKRWIWIQTGGLEQYVARKTTGKMIALALLVSVLTIRGGLITQEAYYDALGQQTSVIESPGLELLSVYFLAFTLVFEIRASGYGTSRYIRVLMIVFGSIFFFKFLRGNRGAGLVVLMTAIFLFFQNSKRKEWKKILIAGAGFLLVFIFLLTWGYVRNWAAEVGVLQAFIDGLKNQWGNIISGGDPLNIQLLPQSYWHLLHAINLYNSGNPLNGVTYIDLIPQAMPEIITRQLGFERPLSGPLRLYESNVLHGGGMYVIAEAFWNFGLLGALGFTAFLSFVCIQFENFFRRQPPLLSCVYFAFLGSLIYAMTYGTQTYFRNLEIAIAFIVIFQVLIVLYKNPYRKRIRALLPHVT